jgi:hypothetical protein
MNVAVMLGRCIETDSGCWEYRGATNGVGYGVATVDGLRMYTHRAAYEYFRAEIPAGLHIDHLCRNTICCNPWHLEPVTPAENIRRGVARLTSGAKTAARELAKTECPLGHPYSAENTYITPKGHRQCLICKLLAQRKYTQGHRAEINARSREKRNYQGPITACRRAGHEYTPENTYINSEGRRICVACRRERAQQRKAA